MHPSIHKDEDPSALNIRRGESELTRLIQTERDLEAGLASAKSALEEVSNARQALLSDTAKMVNEGAVSAAQERVRKAEVLVRKFEEGVTSVRRDRELAQGRLEAASDRARRLDESATVALVVCELVDALKAFERASQRLASALDASREKGAHSAPLVAASLRISETRFGTEVRDVIKEIEGYRAGLVDGSVKLKAPHPSAIGRDPTRSHQFVADASVLSIVPSPLTAPPSIASPGDQGELTPGRNVASPACHNDAVVS